MDIQYCSLSLSLSLYIYIYIYLKFYIYVKNDERQKTLEDTGYTIFHFGQISKFKKGVTPRKKMESKFPVDMRIYTLCPS